MRTTPNWSPTPWSAPTDPTTEDGWGTGTRGVENPPNPIHTTFSSNDRPMTTAQNLRSLIAHTLTEADAAFHGWTFTADDFASYSEADLREFCCRHHCHALREALETTMV